MGAAWVQVAHSRGWPEATLEEAAPCPGHTHLYGVPPRVLGGQQLVTLAVQLVNSLLFGLQVPVDEIL